MRERSLASGTRVLSVGIAATGIYTFAYLATASHLLSPRDYGRVSLAWAVMFVVLSVIYRPIELLLSRTIADRRARGHRAHPLRVPALLQAAFALAFLAAALALRHPIEHGMFGGESVLYRVLVVGVVAYAGSYFARGWLAGHQAFALYGALVFLESTSRFALALLAALGLGARLTVVALGMAIAPFASLAVMPFALRSVRAHVSDPPAEALVETDASSVTLRRGAGFAASVVAIMASEQALMNAGVLVVAASVGATSLNAGLTGFVFDVMLVVRAPLQLFQAVQTSILPHLTRLEARSDSGAAGRAVAVTALACAAFGLLVALGLLAVGPPVLTLLLGDKGYRFARVGLALVGVGLGFHLVAGTLNQAALARGDAARSALCWLLCAGLFVAFEIVDVVPGRVARVEIGYCGATMLLCGLLALRYRAAARARGGAGGARSLAFSPSDKVAARPSAGSPSGV